MKKYVTASYESDFWKLHDRDYETGTQLEDIVEECGLLDEFFPEDDSEPIATESDYKRVLDTYVDETGEVEIDSLTASIEDILADVASCMNDIKGVKDAHYIKAVDAVRFTSADGRSYQLVLQDLRY